MLNVWEKRRSTTFVGNLALPFGIVITTLIIGTCGYYYLWKDQGGTLLDALYMTVITIATIGFGEVKSLDSAGRIFTIVITFVGMGGLVYVLTAVMEYLVQFQLSGKREEKKMNERIQKMTNHIILIGAGRVGKRAAKELSKNKEDFVLLDADTATLSYADENGFAALIGDGTDDAVLQKAGIEKAKGIIIATPNDATNLFIVLSARTLNPAIKIIARAEEESSIRKLERAGANKAITPHTISGQQLVTLMIHPTVVDFLENAIGSADSGLRIESLQIMENSIINNKTLDEIKSKRYTLANVLVVIRGKNYFANPEGSFIVNQGDHIVALGTSEQLTNLEKIASNT